MGERQKLITFFVQLDGFFLLPTLSSSHPLLHLKDYLSPVSVEIRMTCLFLESVMKANV